MTKLTNYTRGIFERIDNENLHDENNPFVIVFDGTVGEYLENRDNHFLDIFITTAEGDYLDVHGKMYGIYRKKYESDDDYRNRIILDKSILQRTEDFSKLDVGLWVYKDGVTDKDTLTSRNPYLKNEHDEDYVFICSGADIEYLTGKFLLTDILFI